MKKSIFLIGVSILLLIVCLSSISRKNDIKTERTRNFLVNDLDVMMQCSYTTELQIVRSNSYNRFINCTYTWSTIPKPSSIWSYAGFRVSR